MTNEQRKKEVNGLIYTSVQDCKTSLDHRTDPALLCDLLVECNRIGHKSREQVVRRRISRLIKGV